MASITLQNVSDALLLMLGFTFIAVTVVVGVMYWLYRVFKNKKDDTNNL